MRRRLSGHVMATPLTFLLTYQKVYKGPCLQVIEGVKHLQAKSPKYFKYKFISPPLPSEVVPKYQLCAIGLTFELTWQGNAVSRA